MLDLITQYVDFSERKFIEANAYSFLCFALWVLLPHLEFRYKLLSRLTGNDQAKACDFLAYFLIYTGTIRNHAINEAINNNIHVNYGVWEYPIMLISVILMLFGLVLVCLSFYRLGLRGMYFGDHFGFLFKEKIVQFPYNYFDNAQYVGTTAFFLGFSLFYHSFAGVFITMVINLLYKILTFVENRKLEIFYPSKDN
jgi:phosphatidylethanolamine N-methyltransferase